MGEKKCVSCGEIKEVIEYNFKDKKTGRRNSRCKMCTRRDIRQAYRNNRQHYLRYRAKYNKNLRDATNKLILAYLKNHPCVDCGETNPIVLQFDHVRGKKIKAISIMVKQRYSLNIIKKEIEKCDVRCANCHFIKTANDFGHYALLQEKEL